MSGDDRAQLADALTRAGDGVFAVGAEGRVLLWNRAAERILGYGARDVVGRQCCDILAGQDDKGNRLCYPGCHVVTLVKMGESVQNFDMRTRTKSGRGIWLNISILSVANGKDGAPVTVHLFRDVTASKELLTLVHERLSAPAPGENSTGVLTRREVEVLRLMTDGLSTKAVADTLHVSPATVRNHVQNVLAKLGVHSRLEAVAYASKHRLL
jgi:PAS domain S-box-containing protein